MKYLLIIAIVFFSCSRDPVSRLQGEPEISFDLDGKHYEFKGDQSGSNNFVGVLANKLTGTPGVINTLYTFNGFLNNQNMVALMIGIVPPDTLKTITYKVAPIIRVDGVSVTSVDQTDIVNIKITDYRNGVVSADFSGKVTKMISVTPSVTQSAMITNGKIKNVSVRY